jgi:hypothetical protein
MYDEATLQYPILRRSLSAFAKASLADGADLDGSAAETKTRKKTETYCFLTVLSVRVLEGRVMKRFTSPWASQM